MTGESVNRERDENEKNKNKVFIMENAIIKKDNLIMGLRKKVERMTETDDNRYTQIYEKETYIIDPSIAVNQIHDELLLYKQIYENLAAHIRENKDSIMKYESIINELQNENAKLRTQVKMQQYSLNKEKENQRGDSTPKRNTEMKYSMNANTENEIQMPALDINKLKSKMKITDEMLNNNYLNSNSSSMNENKNIKKIEADEWIEILRISGLTPEELDRLAKNKMLVRVIEAIEMLNRLLVDKNLQIRLLDQENENLNVKNFHLNKENITLFQQNLDLKNQLQKYMDLKKKKNDCEADSSMVNIKNNLF